MPATLMVPPGSDAIVGQVLGNYTIRRKLAEGGMGVVYEGEHRQLGRLGAIKVLKLELCGSEDMVERFRQEAHAVSAIRHENIVEVFDFGRDREGRVFFVMEYLDGEPLSARIARGALGWGEAFPVLEQTLRALKAAHDKGYVHRDLKPDNIWLRYAEGGIQVKLLDFGIAKLIGSETPEAKLTRTGTLIGTPHYMSPEQINGSSAIDQRTDLYALGVIIYEMFTGATPFAGETLQAIMTGHLFVDPPRLADIPANLAVPPPIAELVARMLAKRPEDRYASAADVLDDLYDVHRHQWPTHAGTLHRTRPLLPVQTAALRPMVAPEPARRRSRAALLAGLAIAAIGAAGLVWKTQPSPEPPTVVTRPPTTPVPVTPAPVLPPPPPDFEQLRRAQQDRLRASLREPDNVVRKLGSDALGKIRDRESTPELGRLTEHDLDGDVRAHAGEALATIGAASMAPLLARLETGAEPGLKVWYASALAKLGDRNARKRLTGLAHHKQLDIAFPAALKLADVSRPGDKPALDALRALAAREAALKNLVPNPGALLLGKLAALRDEQARKLLYSLLDDNEEGVRLTAAEQLADLGNDAGHQVLQGILANRASPNRLLAAAALIPLGDYSGRDVIKDALTSPEPAARSRAARALGDIGDRNTIDALVGLGGDKEWSVRIAAATAIVVILGVDPAVLAQASVDWAQSAFDSDDLALHKAAAGVLSDLPAKDATRLLAKAIADKDAGVRLAASRSAGRMKTAESAATVVAAVKAEADPKVKEQQIKALGEIGEIAGTESRAALTEIAEQPGRIGVIAAGSLIAVGDTAGQAKLETAIAARAPDLRLAAAEAAASVAEQVNAAAPGRLVVIPTLKIGIIDREFSVRFAAAEGLSRYDAEKDAAVPVLEEARKRGDVNVVGRALAALARLGKALDGNGPTPEQMLDSPDPRQRLAAVPIIRALAPATAVPLVRRLVGDLDQDVRRAGVDAIEVVIPAARDEAIKLYRPLVNDADPVVRSKAAGQLSRIVPPPAPPPPAAVKTASAAATPDDTAAQLQHATEAALAALTPALDAAIARLAASPDAATGPAATLAAAAKAFDDTDQALTKALTEKVLQADAAAMSKIDDLQRKLDDAAAKVREAAGAAEAAAKPVDESAAAADTAIDDAVKTAEAAITPAPGAAPSKEAVAVVEAAKQSLANARSAAKARVQKARDEAAALTRSARDASADIDRRLPLRAKQVHDYHRTWTTDISVLLTSIESALAMGKTAEAKQLLDEASRHYRKSGGWNPKLDFWYGEMYRAMADGAPDPAQQRPLLDQAAAAYRKFVASGSGPNVQRAKTYLAQMHDKLGASTP